MRSRSSEFWGGVRAQLPLLLGVAPFAMIYGILAGEAGLPVPVALGMSLLVFAGSAQFIAAQLFATGAPGLVIILTTAAVNLRHALYSASIAPYVRHLSRGWKFLLAFLLTDEAYAVSITHYRPTDPADAPRTQMHWYFFGAGIALWATWQVSTAVGVLLGTQIPDRWALDFTLPLTFIALLIPLLRGCPSVLAAVTAGATAVAAYDLPYNLWLVLAIAVGMGAGLASERAPIPCRFVGEREQAP